MHLPRSLARFNKRVTNRIQRAWAPYLPPFGIIVHKGRNSGRSYRTPVLAGRSGDRLVVVLFYGADTDWVRNVLAAGRAQVIRLGRTSEVTNPRIVSAADQSLGGFARLVGRPFGEVLLADLG